MSNSQNPVRRYAVLAATVPDCRHPRLARLYLVTAAVATAWVGLASWFLLVWTLKVGAALEDCTRGCLSLQSRGALLRGPEHMLWHMHRACGIDVRRDWSTKQTPSCRKSTAQLDCSVW